MKYRVVTTDYAEDGTPRVEHHEAETFEDARMDAEQLRDRHAVVSVYRYSGGEPDLLWSTRVEYGDDDRHGRGGQTMDVPLPPTAHRVVR